MGKKIITGKYGQKYEVKKKGKSKKLSLVLLEV